MKIVFFVLVFSVLLGNATIGLAESKFDEEVAREIKSPDVQHLFSKYAKTKNADAMRLYKEGTYLINLDGAPSNYAERIHEGVNRLKQALELDPNFSAVHLSLGYAFISRSGLSAEPEDGKTLWKKAKAEFKKALELDPKNADAHREVGDNSNDVKERIHHLKMALELDPEQDIGIPDRARVAESMGKINEAFEYVIQELAETPIAERCHFVKSQPPQEYVDGYFNTFGYFKKKHPKEYKAFVGRVCRGEGMPEYKPPCEECGE